MILADKHKRGLDIINNSGEFDAAWYLAQYPDVAVIGIDPVLHYLCWGARIGRNPNKDFDSVHYLAANPDVAKRGMNPFVHYLAYGKAEGRALHYGSPAGPGAVSPLRAEHEPQAARRVDCSHVRCTVVVPVYNAYHEVLNCIDSVLRHTEIGEGVRLLILDDKSQDDRIRELLDAYSAIDGIEVVYNERNIGYTANVNQGCALAGEDDVVLLNSDTIVGPHWVRNLKQIAYHHERIGTVTAVSDNAGAFSVPHPGTNYRPDGLGIDAAARVAADIGMPTIIEVPTGNGFCIYIRRALLREIGAFDEDAFPRGYGEENDFCMRALAAGWINLVAAGVYVAHVRSASFKDEKESLMEAGVRTVMQRHPGYAGAIKSIGSSPTFKQVRSEIGRAFDHAARNGAGVRPRIMFVLSTRSGGTPQTNRDLMNAISDVYECYALRCDRSKIELLEASETDYRIIKTWRLRDPLTFATHVSHEYDEIVRSILVDMSIDLLHIRHIAWHSLRLPAVANGVGIPVVNSFHDFYTVCPTVNLIDREGKFLPRGVPENGHNPLWSSDPTALPMTQEVLDEWQQKMQSALRCCDAFVTTCRAAKDIILDALPGLAGVDFNVIPHGRDFEEFNRLADESPIDGREPLRVLVPGNIGLSKGKELIKRIKQADRAKLVEFHVLGSCDDDLKPWVVDHGKYERNKFSERVASIRPHIAAIFSIWPETYCHTLTESWACGLPVLGIAHGAVAERIGRHGGGWLVSDDIEAILSKLLVLRESAMARSEKVAEVLQWQTGYGRTNSTTRMSERYLALYRSVMGGRRSFHLSKRKRTAFVMQGRFPKVPATAYVRLVDWKPWFEKTYGAPVDFVDWSSLLRAELANYSTVVVQRNAIPAGRVDAVLDALNESDIRLVYEIDDNLFQVPPDIDDDGIYAHYRESVEKLCTAASQVHVTNDALAEVCGRYNSDVLVRPNKLPSNRWRHPAEIQPVALPGFDANAVNVLYFGSRTHGRDLQFAIDSLRLARSRGANVHLHVVGMPLPNGCNDVFVHQHEPPVTRYDLFVDWLRSISGAFDAGIAPLVDARFAATKSYLKVLEYAALGLPSLCSNGFPYAELGGSDMSDAIVFLENDIETWAEAFLSLRRIDATTRTAIRGCMKEHWLDA